MDQDYVISLRRTVVPLLAGAIVSVAVRIGFHLDSADVVNVLTPLVTAVYYVVLRGLEKRWPWVGTLLGARKTPSYAPGDASGDASGD
jgi:hypothetical protein